MPNVSVNVQVVVRRILLTIVRKYKNLQAIINEGYFIILEAT